MYNLILEPGQSVNIFTDPKDEESKLEGTAILIEKLDSGDSFYLDYEEMYKPYTTTSSLSVKPDEFQVFLNTTYDYLDGYFTDISNPDVKKFKKDIKKECSKKNESYNKMYEVCEEYRDTFKDDSVHILNNVFEVDNKYIVRYFQQTSLKNWRPTIFILEKWVVEFFKDDDPFFSKFTTTRWVKLLLKSCPNELSKRQDLSKYTTYNGNSSLVDSYDQDDE